MTGLERGFLLLCSHLGDPDRRPLTTAQVRKLTGRISAAEKQNDLRQMVPGDLTALGYGPEDARRIVGLMNDEALLDHYLRRAGRTGCAPLTRASEDYPLELRHKLGADAPGCLWYRGNLELLKHRKIALVGSRELLPENAEFARQAGIQCAAQGFVLVSGNARGADKTAQEACLESGGSCIIVVADELGRHCPGERTLYLSEDCFDFGFSPLRALSRNRVIHAMGECTLVAQSSLMQGGSWDGAVKNLRFGWSSLHCFADRRESTIRLELMGADVIGIPQLQDLDTLHIASPTLFDK